MHARARPRVIRQEEIAEFRLSERPDFLAEKTGTARVALSADGTAIVAAKPRVRVERNSRHNEPVERRYILQQCAQPAR